MFIRIALMLSLLGASDSNNIAGIPADILPATTLASIPRAKTPAGQLTTKDLRHYELLRVPRDFGKESRDIVLDAWVPRNGPAELSDVRLWWLERAKGDLRKPFGKKTLRHINVEYKQDGDGSWEVAFGGMGKMFPFNVELDDRGKPRVFANVRTKNGKIDHCRVLRGKLFGRKILDKTIGLDHLQVRCKDDDGKVHSGELRRRGR